MTFNNRGDALRLKTEYEQAIADFDRALRLNPDFAYAYNNRGLAWSGKREYGKAIADFSQAVRLDPELIEAQNNTAWLLATCPDERFRNGRRSVELAKKACELSGWTLPGALDTLAAAYAEAGKFDLAVKYEKQAIELTTGDADAVRGPQQRLDLFIDHLPFRDE
jgi:tetratricopeptide (TPR) repeat protein